MFFVMFGFLVFNAPSNGLLSIAYAHGHDNLFQWQLYVIITKY